MRVSKLLRDVTESVGKHGLRATAHDLQIRLANTAVFLEVHKAMTLRLENTQDRDATPPPGFEAGFVPEAEIRRLARDERHRLSPQFVDSALAKGDRCYAIFESEALAAYGWFSGVPTLVNEHFRVHFGPDWIYRYNGYTLPAYRGHRLHAAGICGALRSLTLEGRSGLISSVASNNLASMRSSLRTGYRIFGDVYLLRVGGRSFSWASRACRNYGYAIKPV